MRRYLFTVMLITMFYSSFAQTNTFPESGNVGIGTTSPNYKLEVHGVQTLFRLVSSNSIPTNPAIDLYDSVNGTEFVLSPSAQKVDMFTYSNHPLALGTGAAEKMRIGANGNVGIGTTNPLQKFVVSNNGADGFEIYLDQPNGRVGLQTYNRAVNAYSKMQFDASHFSFSIGNVGIGTTDTQGYKLAVNGKIRTQEIKVENANWPDYVFTKEYQLPTLQQTEQHIKEKGHLPGIPSAEEVKAKGIDLGEMNAKLLQKIEELTLHLIQQDKNYKELQEEVRSLKGQQLQIRDQK